MNEWPVIKMFDIPKNNFETFKEHIWYFLKQNTQLLDFLTQK